MNSSELAPGLAPAVRILLAVLPVLAFLLVLLLLDSFRLVRPRRLVQALGAGGACALGSYFLNSLVIDRSGLSVVAFAVFVAPFVEEGLKGLYTGWLLRTRRAGFLVDAAVLGFAVGSGFALVENLYYLRHLPQAPTLVWIIRGFGTAIMHGGAAAVMAVTIGWLQEVPKLPRWAAWLAGLLPAVLLHAGFNRFMTQPLLATTALLLVLPLLLRGIYALGERRLRAWLGRGFDRDSELLDLIRRGQVRASPLGRYLESLSDAFRRDKVADMLCLLRLQAELSIRIRGTLLLREQGLEPAPAPELPDKLAEVAFLERSLGRTGTLALRPVSPWRGPDRWLRGRLEDEAARQRKRTSPPSR